MENTTPALTEPKDKKSYYKIGNVKLLINEVDSFSVDAQKLIPTGELHYVEDEQLLEDVALFINSTEKKPWTPILFEGPTGCGKTALVKYLAKATKTPYFRVPINGATSVDDFLGYILAKDGSTYWVDGILTKAMKEGHWLFCDEMNAALPEVLFVLNSLLDDDRMITLPGNDGEIVHPHPNFRLFAAQNPSDEYSGTKETNRALRNRFQVFELDYPTPALEVQIIMEHTDIPDEANEMLGAGVDGIITRLVRLGNALRVLKQKEEIISPCSTRQLINIARLSEEVGMKKAAKLVLVHNADVDDRKQILAEINKQFSDTE